MGTVEAETPQKTQALLAEIERLGPVELDLIARRVRQLRTAQPETEPLQREAKLLRVIRRRPAELGSRYRELLRKLEAETLTPEERRELLPLTEIAEAFAARRVEALIELANLRHTSLVELMRELDIRPRRA